MLARSDGRHHARGADGGQASYVAAIVTANRPAALERCVTSVLTSTAPPTLPPVHVFDNSRDVAVDQQKAKNVSQSSASPPLIDN